MIVGKIILSGNTTVRFDPAQAGLLCAARGDGKRLTFAGKTVRGRSGIALNLFTGRITGHKIDPVPAELPDLVRHVPRSEVRNGLLLAAMGEDVLIGDAEHRIAIKWTGSQIEVFGSGDDSHS